MQASTMRKNKIFMFLCVACIQECLTRERSPLQPFTFSTPELAFACAQLVVAGTELTRAAERWPSLSRASPAHPLFPPSLLRPRLDAVYHRAELDRRWDFRAIRQQSVHAATRFHARVIRMYNAASAIAHSPGSMRRFCDLVRRRVPPLS